MPVTENNAAILAITIADIMVKNRNGLNSNANNFLQLILV